MLMRRLFIIDCPGIVYDTGDDEIETVLKGDDDKIHNAIFENIIIRVSGI